MSWLERALDHLSQKPISGYQATDTPAVEPTALAAMALVAHGRTTAAFRALDWLGDLQSPDGFLGIRSGQSGPHWATGWAVMAWMAGVSRRGRTNVRIATEKEPTDGARNDSRWSSAAERACHWLLTWKGEAVPRSAAFAHDTTLQGWSWVEGTHSWVEPTAINLMALKVSGYAEHPRCREAVRLLVDRMLASGGWNYGNTAVLGTPLRSHVQPTGLALAALAREETAARACERAARALLETLSPKTTPVSLGYALIGITGHAAWPPRADTWLAAAGERLLDCGAPAYGLSLLLLAARREDFLTRYFQ